MSGYELKKQLSVKLGAFWRVSYGSLYPCLKRLAADGTLDVEVSPFTSRKKHIYRLTDKGNRLFHQLLETADGHELEQDRRASVRTARERMDAYTIELMDHGLDEREREIAWLDRLIARERRSTETQHEQDPAEPSPPAPLPQSPRDPRLPAQPG